MPTRTDAPSTIAGKFRADAKMNAAGVRTGAAA